MLVIGFADDVITPAALGREVAEAMPNGRFIQIGNTGHLGFLERPDTVNNAMLQFFARHARISVAAGHFRPYDTL